MYPHHEHSTTLGTGSGTVLTVFVTIDAQDYLKTVVLAIVGATVSFVVSLIFKWVMKKVKK